MSRIGKEVNTISFEIQETKLLEIVSDKCSTIVGTNRMNETVLLKISKIVGVFREGNSIGIFLLLDIILYATNWKRGNKARPCDERRSAKRIK